MPTVKAWEKEATKLLVGATITSVGYQTQKDAGEMGWDSRGLLINLKTKDGGKLQLLAARDDEGNDAGAIFTSDEKLSTIPVLG